MWIWVASKLTTRNFQKEKVLDGLLTTFAVLGWIVILFIIAVANYWIKV